MATLMPKKDYFVDLACQKVITDISHDQRALALDLVPKEQLTATGWRKLQVRRPGLNLRPISHYWADKINQQINRILMKIHIILVLTDSLETSEHLKPTRQSIDHFSLQVAAVKSKMSCSTCQTT